MLGISSFWGQPLLVQRQPVFDRKIARQPERGIKNVVVRAEGNPSKTVANKPIATALDFDGTLAPWIKQPDYDRPAYSKSVNLLRRLHLKNNNFLIVNTGRSLASIKEITPMLSRLPFDALGLNDGQQLFLKPDTHSLNLPEDNKKWLLGLAGKHKDKHWKTHLSGWSTVKVLSDIRKLLPGLGFQQVSAPGQKNPYADHQNFYAFTRPVNPRQPEDGLWVVQVRPDQAFFEVNRSDNKVTGDEIFAYASLLSDLLGESLQKRWPQLHVYANGSSNWSYIHIGPRDINKAVLMDYLVGERFSDKPLGVISAGDSVNDTPLLSRHFVTDVPNYPILVGSNPRVTAVLKRNPPPNLEQVGWNRLDEGLEKQFNKIKPELKDSEGDGNRLDATG